MSELDDLFGRVRPAERIDEWELGKAPLSLALLDAALAVDLVDLRRIAQSKLLRWAAQAQSFLWVMSASGDIYVAVEEIAPEPSSLKPDAGYPRRRGYKHPSEERKLGHPTLVDCGPARIAGELALDEGEDGQLQWIFNVSSGRYCRQLPPTQAQASNAADRFKALGIDVLIDED